MQVEISEYRKYIVLAGNGNKINRYKVPGNLIKTIMATFERVVYVGLLEGFECYTKNPETGEGGWDIVWIEGVKEKIQRYYPNFDCFITQDYPRAGQKLIQFDKLEREDYEMLAFTTDNEDPMTEQRIDTLFDCLIDNDVHTTIDYMVTKGAKNTSEELLTEYDSRA